MRSPVRPLAPPPGPLLLAHMVTPLDLVTPPMEPRLGASITPGPQDLVTLSTGPQLVTPSIQDPRPGPTTMGPHPQEPQDTLRVLVQRQAPLRHTRGLMDPQALDPRGHRPTELWDTRPRGLHQVLPNLVQVAPQEAPLQEPLELHHQEAPLPPELLIIPADQDQQQTTSRSWRTPSHKWRRRGCRGTRGIMRPGGCTSRSHLAQTARAAIPPQGQEVPQARPLASTRVN